MSERYIFDITDDHVDQRIDAYIRDCIPDLSRSYIQKLIKEERVWVNDKVITKPSFSLSAYDQIVFDVPDQIMPDIKPENIPLDILYEDDDLMVINKPKGMVVHPAPGHYEGTLVNAIMYHCGDRLSGINGVMRPGIVHRIDKDTSGSLLICKSDFAHHSIADQLKSHLPNRIYHAVVFGHMPEQEGTIDAPIGRDPKNRLKMAVVQGGKRAVTHYKVLKEYQGFSYIACKLETGRTHQIRVHMSHIGHPIVGDALYMKGQKDPCKCEGQTLHAKTIGFTHPRTEAYMEFDTNLPEYFQKILEIIEQ